jgi:hypothetical protein
LSVNLDETGDGRLNTTRQKPPAFDGRQAGRTSLDRGVDAEQKHRGQARGREHNVPV